MKKVERRHDALRAVGYAMSLAIELLGKLDNARAQLQTMEPEDDGRLIVIPCNTGALDQAVGNAHRECREVKAVAKKSGRPLVKVL